MRVNPFAGPAPAAAAATLAVLLSAPAAPAQLLNVAAKAHPGDGILLAQNGPGQPWRILAEGDQVPAGLLVVGAGGSLDSVNAAVRLTFVGGVSWAAKFPVMESGVFTLPVQGADLAFGLERGRVDLFNRKKEGAAKVRLASPSGFIDLTLKEPGTHVILERSGRCPAGMRFRAGRPSAERSPVFSGLLAVAKGEVSLTHDGKTLELKAPPGPAVVQTDDLATGKPEVVTLEKLPEYWGEQPEHKERAKKGLAALRKLLATKPLGEAAEELTRSDDAAERHTGLIMLAATDDLPRLGEVLATTKHPDVSDFGVVVLRNWLGRAPGQDVKLYAGLVNHKSYTPAEAETLINLLHGFSDEDLHRPETYQALIDYLDSDRLGLRTVAQWHLVRLVPAGRSIAYDPHADKAARKKARAEWHKLLPPGKLPADVKKNPEKK